MQNLRLTESPGLLGGLLRETVSTNTHRKSKIMN